MSSKNKNVFVGLSGGVDSSVSALLLKQQGYKVTGVFIKGWQPDWIPCTWKDDRISAMRTAAHLDIPFITLDLEQTYKNKVVSYLLEEYKNGRTPNPDMLCNREVKFGEFLKWAMSMGADKVAMGHYARVQPPPGLPLLGRNSATVQSNVNVEFGAPPSLEGGGPGWGLYESNDKEKDQSYFLSQLTQKELSKIIFPIGHLQKSEVRKIAEVNNLPVASRKDSQGICFVGELEMKDFLKRELKPKSGNVLNQDGEIIGEHEGAILYTMGERHGFKIFKKEGDENLGKYFVVGKDVEKNILTVSTNLYRTGAPYQGAGAIATGDVKIKNMSFTQNYAQLQKAVNLSLRIRYRGTKLPVLIKEYDETNKKLELNFKNQTDQGTKYAAGQFAVFYDGEICLGGGELC